MSHKTQTWQNYEELARYVLSYFANELKISKVEAKQRLMGTSGTKWEIDAKGMASDGGGFFIIECKQRTKARLNKSVVAALECTVRDLDARGGVIVTTIGLQKGAEKLLKHYDFKIVYLPKSGTFEQFIASCGDKLVGKFSDQANSSVALTSLVFFTTENKK